MEGSEVPLDYTVETCDATLEVLLLVVVFVVVSVVLLLEERFLIESKKGVYGMSRGKICI